MRTKNLALVAGVASGGAVAIVVACSDVNSEDVKTTGIDAHYAVVGTGPDPSSVAATAYFKTGSSYLDLTPGQDQVTFESVALTRTKGLLNDIEYVGKAGKKAPGTMYTFAFTRPGESHVATVAEPPPVSITEPAAGAHIVTSAPFYVRWKAEGTGKITITFTAGSQSYTNADGGALVGCGGTTSFDVDDTGEHMFASVQVLPPAPVAEGGAEGGVDGGADGGPPEAGSDGASAEAGSPACPASANGAVTVARRVQGAAAAGSGLKSVSIYAEESSDVAVVFDP
jgi:hypothetical protein